MFGPEVVGDRVYMTMSQYVRLKAILGESIGQELSADTLIKVCEFIGINFEVGRELTIIVVEGG